MYKVCQDPTVKLPLISEAIGIMIEARLKMISMVKPEDINGFTQCLNFFESEIKNKIFEHNHKKNENYDKEKKYVSACD